MKTGATRSREPKNRGENQTRLPNHSKCNICFTCAQSLPNAKATAKQSNRSAVTLTSKRVEQKLCGLSCLETASYRAWQTACLECTLKNENICASLPLVFQIIRLLRQIARAKLFAVPDLALMWGHVPSQALCHVAINEPPCSGEQTIWHMGKKPPS